MFLFLININTTLFLLRYLTVEKTTFRVDFVTRLSYLAAWPSLEPKPLQVNILFFFFGRPTDPPSEETGRWETKHFIAMAFVYPSKNFA